MDKVGKPTGLTRRKDSATWYFRQRWPTRYRTPNTPAEIWISLGTAVYEDAIEKLNDARAQAREAFLSAQTEPTASGIISQSVLQRRPTAEHLPKLEKGQTKKLARDFFASAINGMDATPLLARTMAHEEATRIREEISERHSRLSCNEAVMGGVIEGAESGILTDAGLRANPKDEASILLREYLRRALVQLEAIQLARFDGDFSDKITDRMFTTVESKARAEPRSSEPISTSKTHLDPTIIDAWANERNVKDKGIDKHRAVIRWFYERVGKLPVEQIDVTNILAFKNKLVADGTSPANINAKLSCLRTLLQYALENGYITTNPAGGLSVMDKDAAKRKRKEFDLASLNAIFSSLVYAEDMRPTQGRGEAAYWIPLIALYTGARLEEIAQLRPLDIKRETYIDGADAEKTAWVISISEDGNNSLKTANSERRVPVHPELQRLGLIRFAQDAEEAEYELLFHDLRRNKYGRLGAKWGEWWSTYRREVCGISDRRMVFHSFRHTFKYYARHVGMLEGVQRQIMGHSPGDTADHYAASGYSLHQLVEGMSSYRVPGLRLPPPPPPYRNEAVSSAFTD